MAETRAACNCGCGQKVLTLGSKYCRGHNLKNHGPGWQKGWCKGLTKETDERVRRIAKARVGQKREPAWNKGLTKETDGRVKKYAETKKSWHPTQDMKEHLAEVNKGKKHSVKTRRKMRLAAIRNVEMQRKNMEPLRPRIGGEERNCLDVLQRFSHFVILRQFPVAGYFLDGYIREQNLAIEFDEIWHNWKKEQKRKDKQREIEIINVFGCVIFRIKESEWIVDQENIIQLFLADIASRKQFIEMEAI